MKLFQSAWALVEENKRAYIVINVIYYGLILVGMGIVAFNRPLQDFLLEATRIGFSSGGLLGAAGDAYSNAEVLKAVALTFLINLFLGSLIQMTVPSLIIPGLGLLLGVYRAILWGMLFYPGHPDIQMLIIPHSLVLILEGQAYILVMFVIYLHARAWLKPRSLGLENHKQGYLAGLKQTGKVYVLVTLVLLIAAVYEVIEVVLMNMYFA